MSTDINVISTSFQIENRSWDLSTADMPGFTISGTLDVSGFTQATHYANGYFPSGIVLGKITATGLYGPYDDTASDGRQTAVGYLHGSVAVPTLLDLTKDVGCAILVAFTAVNTAKLPIANAATGGGFIDANGKTDLKNIFHL